MILIGVITDKKGYIGEMLVTNLIASKLELPEDIDVNIGYSANFSKKYKLKYWKCGSKSAKIRLEHIESDLRAKELIEMGIFVEASVLKESNPEKAFSHELINLDAVDTATGQIIGKVKDLLYLPANDVIVIEKENTYLNLPLIEEFITDIDIKNGKIFISLPDGSEELEEPK